MSETVLSPELRDWLAETAHGLDTGEDGADALLPRLAQAGLPAIGVPEAYGGAGGDVVDGVRAIAALAEESLAAAFVLWGHRTYIDYLLQSPNEVLREKYLPSLLTGEVAGATGLSNAMKFLAGLEPLQITARAEDDALVLNGAMPWVTNLRPQGFHVAAAVDLEGGKAFIASLAYDDEGLARSPDLSLMALRGTNTAAIRIENARIPPERIIHPDAAEWLPRVRPAFAGLQCGLSLGLARRALREAGEGRGVLAEPIRETARRLASAENALFAGLRVGTFVADAPSLFRIRIELADVVAEAVSLELQACGGKAYLAGPGQGFQRRWREAAFIPVVTPSLVQLKGALAALRRNAA